MEALATIDIDAPAALVWEILTDLERYGDWNPFVVRVKGQAKVGETVTLTVKMGSRTVKQRLVVRTFEAPSKLVWTLSNETSLVLRGGRTQTIEDLGGGRSRYISREELLGLASPVLGLLSKNAIQQGMEAGAKALKARAEARKAGA